MTHELPGPAQQLDALIAAAAAEIARGGIVAFPTETVYGLGANAFDALAVARVFEMKARPHFDPLIVHIADERDLSRLVTHVPDAGRELIARFWPGPLTLVLPKCAEVPDLVTSGLPSVAVRMPAHPVARRLIEASGTPIAAPSANRFGRISPTTAAHVQEEFGDQLPWIVDAGACPVGVESTVVSLLDERRPRLLRPGGITLEELQAVLGPVETSAETAAEVSQTSREAASRHDSQPAVAPGMLASHYAPATPLWLVDDERMAHDLVERMRWQRWGWLGLRPSDTSATSAIQTATPPVACEYLSATGDLHEAAANLFAAMRRLDHLQFEAIVAAPVLNQGVGRAINDRLRRAAAQTSGH